MTGPRLGAGERLFFALWPDGRVREALAGLARQHHSRTGGRPVAPENLHLTLVFLGSVDRRARERLEQGAREVVGETFVLPLEHLGHWPRPRVLWSAPGESPAALLGLVRALRALSAHCGVEPETRPFSAHLTLARKVSRAPRTGPHPVIRWPVAGFCLVRSHTLPGGARYEVLRSWALRRGGSAGDT